MLSSKQDSQPLLLSPGPTPVPEPVRDILAAPLIHHRTDEYRNIFRAVSEGLQNVFRTRNPVFTLASSGTGAMEASLVNFCSPGDRILVLACGKFSERFAEIAKACGIECDCLRVPYGEAADPDAVEKQLEGRSYRAVYSALCETSTGVLNDIRAIGRLVARTDAIFVVDAISGLLADRLETDDWNVDVAIGASQKALMLPPGAAFLAVSPKAWAAAEGGRLPRYYLDLRRYRKAFETFDTPFTPAISILRGLEKSLEMISDEGIEAQWVRCAKLAGMIRPVLESWGLEMFPRNPSSALTAVRLPAGIDGTVLLKILRRDYGVFMAGGQGDALKGRVLRIGHMGAVREQDLLRGLEALSGGLARLGHPVGETVFDAPGRTR
ncbi:MAG TPA: alanine--glyoxylate aminotransferase family protein [Candidatus Omnitrophota bacterium]|nr:alanine--glyoxylate aminotransferase family protein [Candidatus Omnitrophota bacterium]